jgi:hypothetical protein
MQPVHFRWNWGHVARRVSSLFSKRSDRSGTGSIAGFRSKSHREKGFDDARGPVKSDPAIKIRRHKSSVTASASVSLHAGRPQKSHTSPSSPDPSMSSSWGTSSPPQRMSSTERASSKGKERAREEKPRGAASKSGHRLHSKSNDHWPRSGASHGVNGSRLTVSTKQDHPDPASKSTSALQDEIILNGRRGSVPFIGSSGVSTQASSSLASSPTDTTRTGTGAYPSRQGSRATSTANLSQQPSNTSRSRNKFTQMWLGAMSSLRIGKFSNPSQNTSPTESDKGGRAASMFNVSGNGTAQHEESAIHHQTPRPTAQHIGPSNSGPLTADRRASSWGQGDTIESHPNVIIAIPPVRSLDSALLGGDLHSTIATSRIISGAKSMSLTSEGFSQDEDDEDDHDAELGPACYDDDSSTIASGGDQDDLGDIIRSDSGGEILHASWMNNVETRSNGSSGEDSVVHEHVIHNAPFGDMDMEEDTGVITDDESEELEPVTFSPRKKLSP